MKKMSKEEWNRLCEEEWKKYNEEKEIDYVNKIAEKYYKAHYGFAEEHPMLFTILIVIMLSVIGFFFGYLLSSGGSIRVFY